MRKLMMLAGAMIMAAAVNASEVATVAFKETNVSVPARVRFVKGEIYGFSVEAKDSVVARSVRCMVKDGVLRFSFGSPLQPGEVKYDAKKDAYYYGVNKMNMVLTDENETEDLVITVVAPEMPLIKVPADYMTVSKEAVEAVKDDNTVLTMTEV